MKRYSGILMPMSSLPSPYGIGNMGRCAYEFIDFLKAAGQKYWQLLPLGPTSYGDSPYSSFSTFAGNPYYIDPDMLVEDGLLEEGEPESFYWCDGPDKVDYGTIYYYRFKLLRLAFERGRDKLKQEVEDFRRDNHWVDDYALFMAVKESFGMVSWLEWPDEDIRFRRSEAMESCRKKYADSIEFWTFLQYLFNRQWTKLRAYAAEQGIKFIGDIPIYVAMDSADVWSNPELFLLDEEYKPVEVAGCPPDAFTEDGQLWGNPLYRWDVMQKDGFGWWIRRIEGAAKLYDVIRIDHFRGFESYWAVPAGDKTARYGQWKPGPGMALVGVLTSWFSGTEFIAEDLGVITPGVRKLLDDSGLPGMKVMEWAFDVNGDSDYMPHNCCYNSVYYIGTHDNDTVIGWEKTTPQEVLDFARDYMKAGEEESIREAMLRTGMASSSKLFVMQMQDILGLDENARMNFPGIATGNWRWRMLPGQADAELAEKLLIMTKLYRRA